MYSKELSRQEYTARINRVMDYVSNNIDKQFSLNKLAGIATFSPYHFHRIFTYIVGETPNNFVSRIRLEKAAQILRDDLKASVADVVFRCGFINASSFSRAFKSYFGMTTKEFREHEKGIYIKGGIRYGKNCKAVSKIGKHSQHINPQFCSVELKQLIIMDTKIEIKQMPELNLIYCRHTGAYEKISNAYEKLFKWAGARGLIGPDTTGVTVYHDDPAVTDVEKIRQDACITVSGDVKVEGEFGKETVPAGKYAVGRFEIPVGESFEKAWNTMCGWVLESGFQPSGSPYELYHNDHTQHPEKKFIVDICIPVKPL